MPCFSLSINRVPKNPFQLWQLLHANLRYGFYLGPTQSIEKNSAAFCSVGEPDRILAYRIQDLSSLNTFQKIFCPSCRCSSPRWIGYWGFSSGRWFDPGIARLPRKENHLKSPDMIFGRAPLVLKMDFINKKTSLFWHESRNSGKAHKKFERIKNIILQEPQNHSDNFKPLVRRPQLAGHFKFPTASRFPSMVRFTKEAISRGDIYQANISLRFRSSFQSSPIKLYEQLYEANPSPYACLLKCGSFWLVSNSPELLFKIEGSKIICIQYVINKF
jgi:anthranilate/para-aminobenzoate synthase component I